MSAGTIFAPSWAVSRRNELVEAAYQDTRSEGLLHSDCLLLAFAWYIEAHEEPPVDPLWEEAERLVYEQADGLTSRDLAHAALRRGIELASKSEPLP